MQLVMPGVRMPHPKDIALIRFQPGEGHLLEGVQANAKPKPARQPSRHERKARIWLRRFGAKACLLSWLPLVGDPLCAVAGWLRLPFWPCVFYMAIGKFLRYLLMTSALIWLWPS